MNNWLIQIDLYKGSNTYLPQFTLVEGNAKLKRVLKMYNSFGTYKPKRSYSRIVKAKPQNFPLYAFSRIWFEDDIECEEYIRVLYIGKKNGYDLVNGMMQRDIEKYIVKQSAFTLKANDDNQNYAINFLLNNIKFDSKKLGAIMQYGNVVQSAFCRYDDGTVFTIVKLDNGVWFRV